MRVAAVQLESQATVHRNLSVVEREVERAADKGAELVLLPEGFAFLGAEEDKRLVAESLDASTSPKGPIASALEEWSRRWKITVVGGGLPERSPDPTRPYNTSAVFTNGELVALYRKIHLFDVELKDGTVLKESMGNSPGESVEVVRIGSFQVGLAICYDLRFPELFAAQRERGAQVLTLPAAFTKTTGQAHWHTLLRARAIETQCYVVAAAQWGHHPRGRQTFGHSLILDPWGEVVAELAEGVGTIVADIEPERVESVRAQMPLWSHRRLGC